ncbi:hypothetical protein JOL79_15200 [Microbispora sp. RL4-1S]|uniref:Uncharacterized protein n=1 Tax=Microbispora oryzae TaxID=2806554 RepID=A0A941AIH1_9ACTN|nr:hypothetical protein [Microbispora oryzae]MBP2705161.1 hypothetical protein [Microbispora oryzae]
MNISYPVPRTTTSAFVVAVDRAPTELSSIVPWRVSGPHRRNAVALLGSSVLELEAYRTAQSPWRRMDLDADHLKQVRKARHHVVIHSTAPVYGQPEVAQAVRAVARGVAEAYQGTIADPLTGGVVDHCPGCPGERRLFRIGDDWLGWAVESHDGETACDASGTGRCTCLRVTSRGLRRFGMPEIVFAGGACAHSLCAVTVVRAVAEKLLAGHLKWVAANPGSWLRTLPDRLTIDRTEIAIVSGASGSGASGAGVSGAGASVAGGAGDGEPLRVRLSRRAADNGCLRVGLRGGVRNGLEAGLRAGRRPGTGPGDRPVRRGSGPLVA